MNRRFTLALLALCAVFVGVKLYRSAGESAAPKVKSRVANAAGEAVAATPSSSEEAAASDAPLTLQVDRAWDQYAEAKRQWQIALQRMILEAHPEARAAADANLRLQFMLIESRTRKFNYLLKTDPQRIHRDRGLTAFVEFDWSDEDTGLLRSRDAEFAQLDRRIRTARQSQRRRDEWPAVARLIEQELASTPEFQRESARYRAACERVEQLLEEEQRPAIATSIIPAVPAKDLLPGAEQLIAGLAVKSSDGLIYFADQRDGRATIFDAASRGPAAVVWSIRSEDERLEIAGIDGTKLIVVFNEQAPFENARQAWEPGTVHHVLDVRSPHLGLTPLPLSAAVCEAVLQKCDAAATN